MELLLDVGRPRHWLDQLVPRESALCRVHTKTPMPLREELSEFLSASPGEVASGLVLTRPLDTRGAAPLSALELIAPGAWVVEFAFVRIHPLAMAVAWTPRTLDRLEAAESRARGFVHAGLRAVEQWACAGFPDVVATLGQRPEQLP